MKEITGKLEVSILFGTFQRAWEHFHGCQIYSTGCRQIPQELESISHGRASTTFGRNRDSQTKNPQTNITENKQIKPNTVHGEGSASEADLEDVSEIPSILLPGLGRNKTFTYQNQFMISFMNANYIQIAYLTRTSKVFILWMDLWFQGQ